MQSALPRVRFQSEYPVKKVVSPLIELPIEYQLVEKAGQGSFGEIYKIYNTLTRTLHACKVEFKDTRQQNQQSLLVKEYNTFQQLKGIPQVPQPYQLIQQQDYKLIIMPYYGSGNLEELRKKQIHEKFSETCIIRMAYCLISVIEAVHERKYVHRDIKPENFLVGSFGDHHTVYLIDFGLAKPFVDAQGIHIQQADNKGMVGTARYTSINSHLGAEQSRRDDLEAMCYVLLYLYNGQLPWQNFNCQTRQEKFLKILEAKQKFASGQLEINIPPILKKIYDHSKGLRFDEQPNYSKMKEICKEGFSKTRPYCFDWCVVDCKIKPFEDINDGQSELASEFSTVRKQLKGQTTDQISTNLKKILPCEQIKEEDEESISELPNVQKITKFYQNKKH
ncbi:unnamed protein product (macronuclear) [Paramecium tetraurelia]|uniref:Casein kinase I n=1 Tax=Paramecium tetraurelia TaxID=5888 RepID=A0CAK5_PARTE|nr:uncharacterized protein GSPATT00036602001 [Paramecium tetraurelia]CAK67822.1 unnamed protein product [Paramecium tetraurelia]|eukprot:XP_001435219.1 hypothetical protein (macronuclear) [Paramecium tetraurelia strain d4-2]